MQRPCTAPARPVQGAIVADLWPHPLTAEARETRRVAVRPGETLAGLAAHEARRLGIDGGVIAAAVNGRTVPPMAWDATVLTGGDIVTLRATLRGGGDSDPLRTVLTIAVMVAAFAFAGPLGAAIGIPAGAGAGLGIGAGVLQQAIGGALISLAGNLIINALVPPRLPPTPTAAAAGSAAEQVYSLSGGANRARAYEPLLLTVGSHRVFPDLGAAEYTEFAGDDQHLYQIFHFGLGDLAIDTLKIGDSPLDAFEEVETQWGDAQGRITLVAGNVDSEVGAALEDAQWIERTTAANTGRIGIDLAGSLFQVSDRGAVDRHALVVEIEYWPQGNESLKTSHAVTLENADTTPYRKTLSYDLAAPGTWTVRVRRTTAPSTSERIHDDIAWTALRSYQPDPGDYTGQTRLALKIRASGQLSGRLERLSATVKQKIPVWDGARWSAPQASSNPAWLFRWYARGIHIDGRLVAGAGLAEARIDDAAIQAWGAWCDAQGLACDYVIDRRTTHAEVLTLIAQCGRASPSWQSGRLGVVWEQADRPATVLITPGNIVAGSFEIDYASGKTADEIACRYIDPDLDWQWNTVRRTVPGAAPGGHTATPTLAGVTARAQAAAECNLQAARQVHHRRRLKWEMGAEGMAIARGDVVHLTHALIDGGAAGRLTGGTADHLTLNRPVTLSGAEDYLLLRLADGTLHTTTVDHPDGAGTAGETDIVVPETPLPAAPDAAGASPLDTLWRHYPGAAPPARVRIVAMEPTANGRVRLEAIDEVDAYYAAATADLAVPLPSATRRSARVLHIAISETLIRVGGGYAVEIAVSLTVAGDWRGGIVRAALNGGRVRTVAKLVDGATEAVWQVPPAGTLTVTAIPGTGAAASGAPFTVNHVIQGKLAAPGNVANFLVDALGDGTRRFRWTPPADPDLAGVRIRYAEAVVGGDSPAWDAMTPLHDGLLTSSPYETVDPGAGRRRFAIRAEDSSGLLSAAAATIVAELPDPRLGDAFLWECPSALGWPGTTDNAVRSNDGEDALEGAGAYTWDDLSTWDAWTSWALGDGTQGATAMTYTAEAIDLGAKVPFSVAWEAETAGEATLQYRTAAAADALDAAAWEDHAAAALLTARHLQLRWRLAGNGATMLRLDHLCYSLLGTAAEQKFLDIDTATWVGSKAGGREIPTTLARVTDIDLTLQAVGPGWSWVLDNKNDPTRIKIFDGSGESADATVDAVLHGIA